MCRFSCGCEHWRKWVLALLRGRCSWKLPEHETKNAATSPEATQTETQHGRIQSASPTSARTGWVAVSKLRCVEKFTRPSSSEKEQCRRRCIGQPDHSLCALPQKAAPSPDHCSQRFPVNLMARWPGDSRGSGPNARANCYIHVGQGQADGVTAASLALGSRPRERSSRSQRSIELHVRAQYSNPTIHPGLLDRCVTHEGLQLADAA